MRQETDRSILSNEQPVLDLITSVSVASRDIRLNFVVQEGIADVRITVRLNDNVTNERTPANFDITKEVESLFCFITVLHLLVKGILRTGRLE